MDFKKRKTEIDIAKGIGILLVVAAHSTGGYVHYFIGGFHMPLFFVLGGGGTSNSNRRPKFKNIGY